MGEAVKVAGVAAKAAGTEAWKTTRLPRKLISVDDHPRANWPGHRLRRYGSANDWPKGQVAPTQGPGSGMARPVQ